LLTDRFDGHKGVPVGFSGRTGPITASEAIGLGKVAILVLSRTHSSGVDHHARLDAAAATVGVERIARKEDPVQAGAGVVWHARPGDPVT
jgi:hypothetical protein